MREKIQQITIIICIIFSSSISFAIAQSGKGIRFEKDITWNQVLAKAKAENKYIFMDCYATWCSPCKLMDNQVFNRNDVGAAYNQFISVKVQMDSTEMDAANTRLWYRDADKIRKSASILAYPTYLFFSPEGKLIHKATGYKYPPEFIALAGEIVDPKKQYYSVLTSFQPGKLDTTDMLDLVKSFISADPKLSGMILIDYLRRSDPKNFTRPDVLRYLKSLRNDSLVTENVVRFINKLSQQDLIKPEIFQLVMLFKADKRNQNKIINYLNSLKEVNLLNKVDILYVQIFAEQVKITDNIFKLIYPNGVMISKLFPENPSFVESLLRHIFSLNVVGYFRTEAERTNSDIEWNAVRDSLIKVSTISIADGIILDDKVFWYSLRTKQSRKFGLSEDEQKWGTLWAEALANKYDKTGINVKGFSASYVGNDLEYSIYRYSNNKRIVNKAIEWYNKIMYERALGTAYSYVYAGLLYKAGQFEAAILWQEMMLRLIKGSLYDKKLIAEENSYYRRHLEILEGMKKRLPVDSLIYRSE